MRLEIRVQRSMYRNTFELFAFDRDGRAFVSDLVLDSMAEGQILPPSPLSLDESAAQLLMDELWTSGLRPSEGTGSAGSLAATERHLADMRRLVFEPVRGGS